MWGRDINSVAESASDSMTEGLGNDPPWVTSRADA